MEIWWPTPAVVNVERIFARIEKENPTATRETVQAIYDGCEALKDFRHRSESPGSDNED